MSKGKTSTSIFNFHMTFIAFKLKKEFLGLLDVANIDIMHHTYTTLFDTKDNVFAKLIIGN